MNLQAKHKFGIVEYTIAAIVALIIISEIGPIALRAIILASTKPKEKLAIEYNGKLDSCSYGPPYGCSIIINAFKFGKELGGSEIKISGTKPTHWNLLIDYDSTETGKIEINIDIAAKKAKLICSLDSARKYNHISFGRKDYMYFGSLLDSGADAINVKSGILHADAIIHGGKKKHDMYIFSEQFGYYTNREISNSTLK